MKNKSYIFPIIIGLVFIACFLATTLYYFNSSLNYNDEIIADEVEQLKDIFIRINDAAKIKSFEDTIISIDFLNTISFAGNQVGPMILLYPQLWKGPYLEKNLTHQGKLYQIIKTYKGYFIVPGDGVKLFNGKVIGKDIKFDFNTDIKALLKDPDTLLSKGGKPLAAKLSASKSGFDLLAPIALYDTPVDVY